MSSGVRIYGDWTTAMATLDPVAMRQRLDRSLTVAWHRIGRKFQAIARGRIRADEYEPNSPITVILKGSSKPLVRHDDLAQSPTYEVVTPRRLRVGLIRQRAGAEVVNVGIVLHEGATIDLVAHPNVRIKVWAMVREALGRYGTLNRRQRGSVGRAVASLGGSGKRRDVWVIPAQPFIAEPLESDEFNAYARAQLIEATRTALAKGAR